MAESARLITSDLSPFGARVRLACEFKGLEFHVEPPPGGTGSEEYKKITPFGRIPALIIDDESRGDRVLVESLALLEYIEQAYPEARRLLPRDALGAARARMLALLFDQNVVGALQSVFAEVMSDTPDPQAARAGLDETTVQMTNLVHFFDADGLAVGNEPTFAECAMAPFAFLIDQLAAMFEAQRPSQRVPRFKSWWAQASELPEIKASNERMARAFAEFAEARAS